MDARTLSALGLDLRELAWPDIDAVTVLEEQVFPDDAWSAATWWEELAGRPRRDYLVVVGGTRGNTTYRLTVGIK